MKKIFAVLVMVFCFLCLPVQNFAYTINDPSNDAIGSGFETFGANVSSIYSMPILIDLFTNYTPHSVGSWSTELADVFLTETYHGNQYLWAIPLVNHGIFSVGNMYAVGTFKVSDDFAPSPGFTYNHNVPVRIDTLGNNYGWTSFGGSFSKVTNPTDPLYEYKLSMNLYQDDPNGSFYLKWGTATCGNDVIEGSIPSVPEPASMLLLGLGLVGLSFVRKK